MDKITEPLKNLYQKYRSSDASVSEHTKSAQSITKEWQKAVVIKDIIEAEVEICENAKEKIDIIDFSTQTAYELKVSGKNVEHEFYKDIFKIIAFNNNKPKKKLSTFVFISEEEGIEKLKRSSLYNETIRYFDEGKGLNLNIKVEDIKVKTK